MVNQTSIKYLISTAVSPQKGSMSLEILQRSKEEQQQSFFKSAKNKPCQQWTLLKTSPHNKIVIIAIDLVEEGDTGGLKCIQSKRLPVKVSDRRSETELKKTAIEKHSKYGQEFWSLDYGLLYLDFKEVGYFPESSNVFQFDKYKHDLVKPYL